MEKKLKERFEYDNGVAAPAVTPAPPIFIDNCFGRGTERKDNIEGYEKKKGVLRDTPNATNFNYVFGFEKEMMPVLLVVKVQNVRNGHHYDIR